MVPSSTSTHVEAPASEGRQSSACQTLASEALASEAPASKECYFFRIPPGELSNLSILLKKTQLVTMAYRNPSTNLSLSLRAPLRLGINNFVG